MATSTGCSPPGGDPPRSRKVKRGEGDENEAMISLSALECGVCLSLVCQPVSLSCGHSFCRVCLINTLRRNKKKCPTCRAVCHNSAEDQPEDVMIANIARSCFPELSERRRREVEADRNTWMTVLPVFYYNMPMFPGETLNLHLFEPRYKLMIQRIVNTSRRFAYVPNYTDYTASVGDVALIAEVRECEFLADGRVLLDARLVSRQTVADHFVEEGTQGLHFCRVEGRADDPPADANSAAELRELHERTRLLAERIIGPVRAQIVDRFGQMPAGAEALSLWISSVLPMPVNTKHALLAGKSTMVRLQACERHLASLGGNAPPAPPSRVPAVAVAEAYEAYEAARHLGGDEAAAAAAAAAASAVSGAAAGAGAEGNAGATESGASNVDIDEGGSGAGGGDGGGDHEFEADVGEGEGENRIIAVAQVGPADAAEDADAAAMMAAHARVLAEARAALDSASRGAGGAAGVAGRGHSVEQEAAAGNRGDDGTREGGVHVTGAGSREEDIDRPQAMSIDVVDQSAPSGSGSWSSSYQSNSLAPSSDAGLPSAGGRRSSSALPSPRSMAARGDGGAPTSFGEMKGGESGPPC